MTFRGTFNGGIHAHATYQHETVGRCCAKCKTPYNCGSTTCTCHQKEATR